MKKGSVVIKYFVYLKTKQRKKHAIKIVGWAFVFIENTANFVGLWVRYFYILIRFAF